jgi:TIR domain
LCPVGDVGGSEPVTADGGGAAARVFISYAHDPDVPGHAEAVRDLWVWLRSCGIDARLDRVAAGRRQDWALWMADQIRAADHILIIASPAYKVRAEGRVGADEGRGCSGRRG